MEDNQKIRKATGSRFGGGRGRGGRGGEIVEVQGGHIVRSIGRKDRHSKVCTAKGPKDRRVRLSAHTAIQFYDVQDRLGYDRPSKAVDWLIKKAKPAIDELQELPPWKPTVAQDSNDISSFERNQAENPGQQENRIVSHESNSSFLPPSLDSDAIADTKKSFFPMGASNSSGTEFRNFSQTDLVSRTASQSQDLRLSLQSFQDPIFLHHSQQPHQNHNPPLPQTEQTSLYAGNTITGLDGSGWPENQSRLQRLLGWSGGGESGVGVCGGGGVGGLALNTAPFLQPLFGQTQMFTQRGPLQSSNSPSVRAWIDPSQAASFCAPDVEHQQQQHQQTLAFQSSQLARTIGMAAEGGFSGFRIPTRIQGEEEERDGISDKPSSASTDSRH